MHFLITVAFCMLFGLAGLVYLYKRIRKYGFIKKHKIVGRIIAALAPITLSVGASALLSLSFFNVLIILLHLILFWMLCDLFGFIIKKINRKKKKKSKRYYAGTVAIALTIIYLGFGWFFGHYVFETEYILATEKYVGDGLKIVQITDAHIGVTLDGEDFVRELDRIQKTEPDILVITGDFVDDGSQKADVEIICKAFKDFKTTYGIYFVHGNHDKGFRDDRDFSCEELEAMLEKNGVRVLADESVFIDSSLYIVGRKDSSDPTRKEINELTKELDKSKYIIVLDHQPNDYQNEAGAEVDLVLSGHTHGGQIFPIGIAGKITGAYDNCYGYEKIDGTEFITSSGISAWLPFKTFAISEYVVINVE